MSNFFPLTFQALLVHIRAPDGAEEDPGDDPVGVSEGQQRETRDGNGRNAAANAPSPEEHDLSGGKENDDDAINTVCAF